MDRIIAGLLLAGAALAVPAFAQTDEDTMCAAVYALLAQNARGAGLESGGFDTALNTAQSSHMAANPTDDPRRYSLAVINSAQTLRDALNEGRLTSEAIISTADGCNMRYSTSR